MPRVVRTVVESLVMLAWILPGSVVAFLWIALLDRDAGTLNALLGTPGMAWLLEYPMLVDHRVQHLAGHGVLDAAVQRRAERRAAVAAGDGAAWPGASGWQQLRDVVFPHIRGHVLTNLLLISLWTFNDFAPVPASPRAARTARSEILPVFVYQVAIFDGQLGFGARSRCSCC